MATAAVWPNGLRTRPDITSRFMEYDGRPAKHYGVDFINFDVNYAVIPGIVVTAGWSLFGGGYIVEVMTDIGDLHRWLHNEKNLFVKVGQRVKAATALGYQGSTGKSDGKHLHFAVRKGGRWGRYIDPLPYLEELVGSKPAGGGGTIIDDLKEEEEDMSKPITLGIKNKNGTRQFAIVSPDLNTFIPIWKVASINALAIHNDTLVTYVVKDEWNGFREAAGLSPDPKVG